MKTGKEGSRRGFLGFIGGTTGSSRRYLIKHRFLFTTNGFEMYEWAAKRLLLGACIYGQVIKKRRENRVVRVDRWG
ncbi:hypothetical protein MYX75_06405 [Acidobacteria bacterium AH-259-A15]|nr:hypothetical protein [Acidobacteria bacterium AH-259-A15]